jgi:hypothetical protein
MSGDTSRAWVFYFCENGVCPNRGHGARLGAGRGGQPATGGGREGDALLRMSSRLLPGSGGPRVAAGPGRARAFLIKYLASEFYPGLPGLGVAPV